MKTILKNIAAVLAPIVLVGGIMGCAHRIDTKAQAVYACNQQTVVHETNLKVANLCTKTIGCELTNDFVLKMFTDALKRDQLCK